MRKTTNVIDIDYIYSILKQIPAFSLDYLKYIIFNHIFAYILIIIQMIILYIKSFDNKDTKETIKLILCFLFGCFVFFYMLIGLGKTHYNEGEYWLVHDDLHVMYNVILCSFNLALLNLILKYRLVKELIVGFVLLVSSIYFARSDFYFYKYLQEEKLKPWKVDIYKAEKALRLYNLYNRTAVLDIELCDNDFNWGFFEEFNEREENKFYSTSSYIIYLNQFQKEDKMAQGFIFLNKGAFEASFEQNGGIFTKEELENINFNKLMNKDFILNN